MCLVPLVFGSRVHRPDVVPPAIEEQTIGHRVRARKTVYDKESEKSECTFSDLVITSSIESLLRAALHHFENSWPSSTRFIRGLGGIQPSKCSKSGEILGVKTPLAPTLAASGVLISRVCVLF